MRVQAHGTVSMYTNKNCRCEDCTAAWCDYYRRRQLRLGRAHALAHCSGCGSVFAFHKCGGVPLNKRQIAPVNAK